MYYNQFLLSLLGLTATDSWWFFCKNVFIQGDINKFATILVVLNRGPCTSCMSSHMKPHPAIGFGVLYTISERKFLQNTWLIEKGVFIMYHVCHRHFIKTLGNCVNFKTENELQNSYHRP